MRNAALALLLATSTAYAQPAPDPAETAYIEGKRLYDAQDWDAAIAKFKEAYKLRGDQASLFNIAQAYRLKGDCQGAITGYKTYKRNFPNADNIPKVEKFITDLETNCKPGTPPTTGTGTPPTTGTGTPPTTGTGTPPTTGTGTPPTTGTGTPPTTGTGTPTTGTGTTTTGATSGTGAIGPTGPVDDPDPGHGKRLAGYGLIGLGGVGIIAGVAFGAIARSKANEVTNGKGEWDPSLEDSGEKAQRNSRIGFAVGGVALAGGIVLVILGKNQTSEAQKVSFAPSTNGGTLVYTSAW